jgi:uncharacterized protein (TIGR02996 family)
VSERDALLAAIAAHPDEDTPRLVFADWLDENGDPERAEFIRVQIARAQNADGKGALPAAEVAALAARERALLERNRDRWLAPLRALNAYSRRDGAFWRGFVRDIVVDADEFVERGAELWMCSPGSELQLQYPKMVAKQLIRCPHLARVGHLALTDHLAPRDLRALLESPHLTQLRHLSLSDNRFRDDDMRTLAASTGLPALHRLTLELLPITGATLPALLSRFPHLRHLTLRSLKKFDGEALTDVLAALNPEHFRVLDVYETPLRTAGMRAVATTHLTGITELWMRGCKFKAESMTVLAGATHLKQLAKLYLGDDRLYKAGATALAAWPGLRTLRVLHLDRCHIGPDGAVALARSAHLGRPEVLFLRDNRIRDAGARAIATSEGFSELRELNLEGNWLTATGAQALATSPQLKHLRKLDLQYNAIGDEGAATLAVSPYLHGLRWLTACHNRIGPEAERHLLAAFPDLTVFCADDEGLSDE